MDISVPRSFDQGLLHDFFLALDAARELENVRLDFAPLSYSYPTAMLVAGSKIRSWIALRSANGLATQALGINAANQTHSYLMHLGFFNFIYIERGNRVGEARGSTSYLPITKIEHPNIHPSDVGVNNWYDAIEIEARRLAGVLVGSHDDSEALRTYTYSIREIIRNVFEHSQARECYICGQRWWDGQVEVAIVDEGVGIGQTLRAAYPIDSDADALRLAIQPGTSRTRQLLQDQNVYDNSGFGLYILSNLAASFGWFRLGSGSAELKGQGANRETGELLFNGTFFGMKLQRSPHDFGSVLADIIQAGEDEARVGGINVRASGRSRLVVD